MYIVHYAFAVWLQYSLLDFGLLAIGKAAIVFGGTFILIWVVVALLGGVRLGSQTVVARCEVSGA